VKAADLRSTLREFHRDKLSLRQRHVAVARLVGDYEFNNTYQYVIAREDMHLGWLEAAIADLGGTPDEVGEPALGAGRAAEFLTHVAQDASEAGAFVSRWRERLSEVSHARHRSLLQVILGETLEHKRFFDLMLAGRDDLLGRRANGPGSPGTGDGVLPVRWFG
jgi:hypothetical protein